jgi:PKD repeat protein
MQKYAACVFFIIVLSLGIHAQPITILKTDMAVKGDAIIHTTASDSIDVSQTGPSHTWDFSKLKDLFQDTVNFLNPSSISPFYGLVFNGAAGCKIPNPVPLINEYYGFYSASATAYRQLGTGFILPVINIAAPSPYTSPDTIYKLPLTYGSPADSGSFAVSNTISGFKIGVKGHRKTIVDGWGTIKTPYKTYKVIRVKSVVEETDTLGFIPLNNGRTEYKWLAKGEKIPVFEVIVPANGSLAAASVTYRDTYKYLVNPNGPKVAFTASDSNVMVYDTVHFANKTGGLLTNYVWSVSPASFSYVNGTTAASTNPQMIFTAHGKYTISLKATDFNGFNTLTKTDYINVTAPPQPVADFKADKTTVVTGEAVTFTDLSTNTPRAWLWSFNPFDVTFPKGSSETSQNPVVMFSSPGIYSIGLQASNGGGSGNASKTNYITVTKAVGIAPASSEVPFSVSVYPNPASDMVNIVSDFFHDNVEVNLYDMQGKNVLHHLYLKQAGDLGLDVSALPKGIYFLNLTTADGRYTAKLTKE